MSKPFLITGLPRSRTAWMAEVATTDHSICYHEPTKGFTRWQDVFTLWSASEYEFCGVSDSVMGFHLGEILDTAFPRTLIIERPIAEVERSLAGLDLCGNTNYCDILKPRLDAFRGHPLVCYVDFDDLADSDVVMACLCHLMPGTHPNIDLIRDLQDRNIQANMGELSSAIPRMAEHAQSIFGNDAFSQLAVKEARL